MFLIVIYSYCVCLSLFTVECWHFPSHSHFSRSLAKRHTMPTENIFPVSNNVLPIVKSTQDVFSSAPKLIAFDAVYKEVGVDRVSLSIDSPLKKAMEIIFNPVALVFLLYFILVGYNQITVLFNNIVSALTFRKISHQPVIEQSTDTAFQVFECEVCEMQLRPAKGRAEKILSRDRFRCARCGARASSYYDIEDMTDQRAVARIRKIEGAQAEQDLIDDEDEDQTEPEDIL